MASRYEKNILLQPDLIRAVLDCPRPRWMDDLLKRRVFFVGIGSSFHAAQISKALWRRHVSVDAYAAQSFDFSRMPHPVGAGDCVVLFSHRGSKSFTVEAAAAAKKAGAVTVGLTGRESPWKDNLVHRLDTCEPEDTGAFTKSLTSTLAWIARWIDRPKLTQGLRSAVGRLDEGPPFPRLAAGSDVVLLGDLEREWVARETALKLNEAAYLRARAYGLEEFLHGPGISVGKGSLVVAFSDRREPRWKAVRGYLRAIKVPLAECDADGTPTEARWLSQLFWGQRLTLDACRRLGLDPDDLRARDPRYKKAREKLAL